MTKNLVLIITGIATLFWFKGMYRMLDKIIPDTWFYNILITIVALIIFYLNDGEMTEIAKIQDAAHPDKVKKDDTISTIPHNISSGKIPRLGR